MKPHIRGTLGTGATSAEKESEMTTFRSLDMTSAAAEPKRCTGSAARASPTCMPGHFADGRTPSAQPRRRAKPKPTTSRSTRCAA